MRKNIVIVGGGFAGVDCARYLERRLPDGWDLILLSRENHIVFTPLLAEVVGASISPLHVVWPIRQRLRRTICRTVTVTRINLDAHRVEYRADGGTPAEQSYEHLVLACGSMVNMNMMPGLAAHAFPLKTLGDAFTLRNHLIQQLERAEVETDPERRRHLLSIAVIGGGFSGVEVGGEIFDLLAASRKYYPSIGADEFRVVLLHSPKRLLPEMPEALAEFARVRMQARGIDVRLGVRAQAVTDAGVHLADGGFIAAGTIVCTIGSIANPLVAESGLPLDRGRIRTEADMRVAGHTNVWALGDCAVVPNAYDGQPSPPVAQFAVRQAKQLAANLRRAVLDQTTRPFSFRMLGSFAAIGHRKAVGRVLGLNFSGFLAWFLWRGIYLSKMPTFARRVQIAFDWAWELFFPRDIVQLSRRETERLPREHFEPGEFVFRAGDIGEKFYIIERGKAGVYLEGQLQPVAVLGPGDHFGERALVRTDRRTASLRAEEPLDVLTIGRGPFQDLLAHMDILRARMEEHVVRIDAENKMAIGNGEPPRQN
jgi:NADH dehydrogenase